MNLAGTKKVRKIENEQYNQEIANYYHNIKKQTKDIDPQSIVPCGQRVIIKCTKLKSIIAEPMSFKTFDFSEIFKISKDLDALSVQFKEGDRVAVTLFINQTHFPMKLEETDNELVFYIPVSNQEIIAITDSAESWAKKKADILIKNALNNSPITQGLPSSGGIILP